MKNFKYQYQTTVNFTCWYVFVVFSEPYTACNIPLMIIIIVAMVCLILLFRAHFKPYMTMFRTERCVDLLQYVHMSYALHLLSQYPIHLSDLSDENSFIWKKSRRRIFKSFFLIFSHSTIHNWVPCVLIQLLVWLQSSSDWYA